MRFSIGDLPPINDIEMGDEVYIPVQFGNLGKSWIYNVVVRVQGDGFMNMEGSYYAGNLEKGKFDRKEFTLTPYMAGYLNGSFVFSYEDAEGNPYYDECPFSFMVMGGDDGYEMPPWDMDGDGEIIYGPDGLPVMNPGDGEKETGGFWLFTNMNLLKWTIIIGGGLVIVAVIIVVIVVVVKKSKKKNIIDEDDDL